MTSSRRALGLMALSLCQASPSPGQGKQYIAIIPTFHDRIVTAGRESVVQLQRQRFVLFVYRNAVAVSSEADFLNTGGDTLSQEFALPSTGHDDNVDRPDRRTSNGILTVRMWVEGERVTPGSVHDGNVDWFTIRARFAPGERRRVKAEFWAETSLTDVDSLPGLDTVAIAPGPRGFMLDLFHAAVWKRPIGTIDVAVVLKAGLTFGQDDFSADPDAFQLQDSTITWSFRNLVPAPDDNIVVFYTPSGSWGSTPNTMARLSTYIVRKVYDSLLDYVEQRGDN